MSSLLANDAILWFLSLLVLLLAMMLTSVLRLPPPTRSQPDGDQSATEQAAPPSVMAAGTPPAGVWASAASGVSYPAAQARLSGRTKYVPKHDRGSALARTRVRTVSDPPWGPAPRPPDVRRSS